MLLLSCLPARTGGAAGRAVARHAAHGGRRSAVAERTTHRPALRGDRHAGHGAAAGDGPRVPAAHARAVHTLPATDIHGRGRTELAGCAGADTAGGDLCGGAEHVGLKTGVV